MLCFFLDDILEVGDGFIFRTHGIHDLTCGQRSIRDLLLQLVFFFVERTEFILVSHPRPLQLVRFLLQERLIVVCELFIGRDALLDGGGFVLFRAFPIQLVLLGGECRLGRGQAVVGSIHRTQFASLRADIDLGGAGEDGRCSFCVLPCCLSRGLTCGLTRGMSIRVQKGKFFINTLCLHHQHLRRYPLPIISCGRGTSLNIDEVFTPAWRAWR